jgi:Arc/MetJ-type ribon-helix-helix transcriptional regulator
MKTIEIPDEMYDEIQNNIINACPECGYLSVDEYVREAIRRDWAA